MLALWIILGVWASINLITGIIAIVVAWRDIDDFLAVLFPVQGIMLTTYDYKTYPLVIPATILLTILLLPFTIIWAVLYIVIITLLMFFGALAE